MKEIVKSLEAKDTKMQEKVTDLESKNVEMQEEMKLKDAEMKKKVTQLETKVKEQENILTFLLKSMELPTSVTGLKSIFNNLKTAIGSTGRSGRTPRTCRELHAADPSLPSGMQWIDPDGQGVGDGSIYVYCNMTAGI